MAQLLVSDASPEVPESATDHAGYWYRLQEERRFRLEQLAALDGEPCPTAPHESVQRALRIAATGALAEIDAALDRIRNGRYGVCTACSQRITTERLDVLPMASLCMPCHYNEQNVVHANAG